MDTNLIITKIQAGLKYCSESYSISRSDVRLKIKGDGKVDLMRASDNHSDQINIDVLKIFNITALQNVLYPITPYLKKLMESLAKKKNIDPAQINARIFTQDEDFYPSVYLYNGDKAHCELTINELLNN